MSGRGCGVVSCYHEHVSRLSVTFGAVTLALVTLCVATDRWVSTTEASPVTSQADSSDVTRFRIGLLRICRLIGTPGGGKRDELPTAGNCPF